MENFEKNNIGFEQINGFGSLSNTTLSRQLVINGCGTLTNIITTHNMVVNGRTKIYTSELASLCANGSVYLEKSKVSGRAQACGKINALDCSINALHIDGVATLTKCQVGSIEVEKRGGWLFSYMAKIKLIDTHVIGDIIFKGGNGKVAFYGSSKITGNVIGGTVSHK